MIKTFVLDTNVLLQSPSSLFSFQDNKVVIPEAVIEELDSFKKDKSEKGFNARSAIRFLEELRQKGNLINGVKTETGGIVQLAINCIDEEIPPSWDKHKVDNRILQVCKFYKSKGEEVHLVTKDIIERIKAEIVGVISEDFKGGQSPILDEQYTGRAEVYIQHDIYNNLHIKFNESSSPVKVDFVLYNEVGNILNKDILKENEFIIMRSVDNSCGPYLLGIYNNDSISPLRYCNWYPFGVTPKNEGQMLAIEALMRPVDEIPLVILKGPAGTAKTFLSLAVGLDKCFNFEIKKEYRKMLICRPNIPMDEEIGALPGTEQEKIGPLMRPIYDNLEILLDSDDDKRYDDEKRLSTNVMKLFEDGVIVTEAVAFLRGRSISKQWVIIDEAQNLTPGAIKTIITRAGTGTKIILCGDPEQIDHPYLDSRTNGLTFASEKMKGSTMCMQLTFKEEESVRSKLAYDAIKRM